MTIDAARAGLRVEEVELELEHRATGRDARGFVHRGRQLLDVAARLRPARRQLPRPPAAARRLAGRRPRRPRGRRGRRDRARRRPLERARARASARTSSAGRTTGVLKLVGIPLVGLLATRKLSGALLVGLAANALNQLDTRPGRALKAYLAGAAVPSARRSGSPSCCFPTIFARWRCSGTRGRTRWARC